MKQKKESLINIIEPPASEVMDNKDLSEVLGGWNCGSYTKRPILKDKCKEWDKNSCSNPNSGENYCVSYGSILRKLK